MSAPDPHPHNQVSSNLVQPLKLRIVNEAILAFWSEYTSYNISFNVPVHENLNLRIEPYYGLILNDYDAGGKQYFIDMDFGSQDKITLSLPRSLLELILGNYLEPLSPEHFDDRFVCIILEVIFADFLAEIKKNTGIIVRFTPFTGAHGNFRSQWRVYTNNSDIVYPVLAVSTSHVVKDLFDRLHINATTKPTYESKASLNVVSMVRAMSIQQLRRLKVGEIIILTLNRHPINEPLVLIGNKIVIHTSLKGMELHVTQGPTFIQEIEDLYMSVQENDIDAMHAVQELAGEEIEAQTEVHDTTEYKSTPNVQNSMPPTAQGSSMGRAENALDAALHDYKVTVTFELGRLDAPVSMLSQLTQGSILNLQKEVTEDIYLTVSGRTVAIGEVVQVGRNFGVLIKEVFNG